MATKQPYDDNSLNPGEVHEQEIADPKIRAGSRIQTEQDLNDEHRRIAAREGIQGAEPSFYRGKHSSDKGRSMGLVPAKQGSFFSRHKKGLIFVGAGLSGFLLFFIAVVIVVVLIAPYKAVHFATVLRSMGMARFTYVMNKQFSRVIFDSAVLTSNSTGRFTPPSSSLFHRMVGINPRKQLFQLGHQNKLRFDFTGTPRWGGALGTTNTFNGVTIDGKGFYLDDTARSMYGKAYDDLSRSEARRARSAFANQVRAELSKSLALESRRFRWGVYKGFYQVTGIKLFKWTNRAAAYKELKTPQARALNLTETVERVNGGDPTIKRTGVNAIDQEADEKRKADMEAARRNTEPGERRSKLAESVRGVRSVSTGVMLATIACVVHSLDNAFENAESEREPRIARTNADTQSAADQIKYGDTQEPAVSAVSGTWDNANESAFYHQFSGYPMTKEDQDEINQAAGVSPVSSRFADVINVVDNVLFGTSILSLVGGDAIQDAGCNVLLNQWVQFGIVGAEAIIVVVTAGQAGGALAAIQASVRTALEVVATVGIAHLVGTLIDNAVNQVANTDFSGMSTGPDKFNENYVASRYTQGVGNRQITFGAPMQAKDVNELQLEAEADLREYYREQPFKTRYLAIDNPYSLTGWAVARTPSSIGGVAESLQRGLTSLASIIGSPQRLIGQVANIFTSRNTASAATLITRPDMFGVDEWGWTKAELARVESDPSFEIANPEGNDLIHSVEPQLDALNKKYGKCYAPSYVLQKDKPEECTRELLTSDEALRWRTYMAYAYGAARLTGDI